MIKKNRKKNTIIPPANVVLGVLNDDKKAIENLIEFYNGYIMSSALKTAYSAEGQKVGYYIDDDLAQEIRLSIVECLPNLRKTVRAVLNRKKNSILIVVADLPD